MNLTNFEEHVDDVILTRGKNYYEQDYVVEINEASTNHFVAEIMGSQQYTVGITVDDDGNIVSSNCNCPYDWGDYCKHQVAAFYALRESKNPGVSKPKPKNKKHDIEAIVSNLSKAELTGLVLQLAKEYPDIEKRLVFKYAPADDEIASSKAMIKSYISQYKRRGFIEWRDVYSALEGAHLVLEKARDKEVNGDTESAVMLCITILSVVVDMFQYCDDSSGYVGDVIAASIEIITEAVNNGLEMMDAKQKGAVYKVIMKEALHKRYDGWDDWGFSLMKVCLPLCREAEIRKKFEKQLNTKLAAVDEDNWSSKYKRENMKLIQLELMRKFDDEEKTLQFIYDNITYSSFREKAIAHFLEKAQYSEVIRFCEEGIEADQEYRGLVSRWKTYLLQAYEGLGDIEKQRELMLAFIYTNHFEYYLKLKALYPENEWSIVLQEMLETFEVQPYPYSVYIEILKEEKLTDKLLAYCERIPASIESLYPYLLEDYFDDVNKIYMTFIEKEAANSNDRKQYKKVCRIIKEYKKICGNTNAFHLIEHLKQTYNKRPAFLDELGKIK